MPFGKTQRFPSESSGDCFVIADFLAQNSAVSIASVRMLSISTVSRIAWWSSSMVAVTTIAATRTASAKTICKLSRGCMSSGLVMTMF